MDESSALVGMASVRVRRRPRRFDPSTTPSKKIKAAAPKRSGNNGARAVTSEQKKQLRAALVLAATERARADQATAQCANATRVLAAAQNDLARAVADAVELQALREIADRCQRELADNTKELGALQRALEGARAASIAQKVQHASETAALQECMATQSDRCLQEERSRLTAVRLAEMMPYRSAIQEVLSITGLSAPVPGLAAKLIRGACEHGTGTFAEDHGGPDIMLSGSFSAPDRTFFFTTTIHCATGTVFRMQW